MVRMRFQGSRGKATDTSEVLQESNIVKWKRYMAVFPFRYRDAKVSERMSDKKRAAKWPP